MIEIYLITQIVNTSSIKFYKKNYCLDLIPKTSRKLNSIAKISQYKITLCKIITQYKPQRAIMPKPHPPKGKGTDHARQNLSPTTWLSNSTLDPDSLTHLSLYLFIST